MWVCLFVNDDVFFLCYAMLCFQKRYPPQVSVTTLPTFFCFSISSPKIISANQGTSFLGPLNRVIYWKMNCMHSIIYSHPIMIGWFRKIKFNFYLIIQKILFKSGLSNLNQSVLNVWLRDYDHLTALNPAPIYC
jgi:hypothetical protein